ncbi:MAG: 23S rRNA (pseudouridine(1915)-N(3))-methyltransferase RlmH [Alphaproteobacteria bacterium]|nr:23S rRNA (pseudouridine(1915)-N(3))-methyltransferase RlmH [Alphaproteobacteria bacterium]
MRITLLAIGKMNKKSPEAEIIAEYKKRLNWILEIKELDNATQEIEAKFLQNSIPSGAKVVVMDERGENLSSLDLAKKIEKWQVSGTSEICFLIGGADGHLQSTRETADLLLSFGKQTLPHMLMRAVLCEQIYRMQTIIAGHPYHRE